MTTALEAAAYTADGSPRPRGVRLPPETFDGRVHEAVLHQAVKVHLANQRQGTAKTKTRGLVSGGNRKPWRQKGTGRARQGSIRAPNWPGGGTVFGPVPRDYRLGIPRRVRRLARISALNARARERAIAVVEPLAFPEPKTKQMVALLDRLGLAEKRVLLLTNGINRNVLLSARNLRNVDVQRYQDAAAYDILRAEALLIEEPALGTLAAGAEQAAEGRTDRATRRRTEKAEAPKQKVAAKREGTGARARAGTAKGETKPTPKKAEKPAAKKAAPTKAALKPPARKPAAKKPKHKD